jgi:two-component system chemotaxis sensor kinase CheA
VDVVPGHLSRPEALLLRVRALGESACEEDAGDSAPETSPAVAETAAKLTRNRNRSVKVDTDKLDYLVDMVGELVIAQSLVRHDPELSELRNPLLLKNMSQLARITDEVQRTAMAMRMVPIGPLFQKMNRLARDLSRKSGKPVVMELAGEDVELDRNIVEELADPLMHMVRNAVDHGIESPARRAENGKPATAVIGLRAFHRSGQIVIVVSDDGGGIRRDRVLARARERELIGPNQTLTDSEVLSLIFQPGFSTAEKVSDISGRGVGMDVVRKQIQRLRGSIDITSVEGQGTTFSLCLPLTLAIIDGLVVMTGKERHIIPLASVREMLRPTPGMVSKIENRAEVVAIRDRLLPVVRLHEKFAIDPRTKDPSEAVLVVAEVDGSPFCLMVDELVGKQEVVIKTLGPLFRNVAGIAGGAILGDGHIALILDLKGIFSGRTDA